MGRANGYVDHKGMMKEKQNKEFLSERFYTVDIFTQKIVYTVTRKKN